MVSVRGCNPISCFISALLFVLIGACVGGVFFVVIRSIRDSDVVQEALVRAERDPQVAAALGAPLEAGWFPMGSISTGDGSGNANLTLSVAGPRGSGEMMIEAVHREGVWQYRRLIVTVGGRQIDVLREQ
ncbi:cytochrome c oxidase assembly factor Coa1 family protein [Roseiflexus castenholzii]|uniref:Cytochrome oxidase complex assembly protein 1 n=1 Tax=Roseiflexus castenholzii (strain DSM 13941 / HLO8) TaxID=383372 RepID=A7NPN6_ROSCS|nr:cytochrome c oxidase assembly factor Coa1 family protein [Roseiflexus castenholzii]ABU59532.1 conserved hypothetical protein [Roseiflexus castenholzii DSM 13941]